MSRNFYILAGMAMGLFVVLTVIRQYDVNKQKKAAEAITRKAVDQSIYVRGFNDGMNATMKAVTYNTNTGKITVEMTNVLAEMKP